MAKLKSIIKPQIAQLSIDNLMLSKFTKQTIENLQITSIGELVDYGYSRLVKKINNTYTMQKPEFIIKEIQEKLALFKARIKGSDFDVYDVSVERLDLPESVWEVLDGIPKIKNLGDLANYGVGRLQNANLSTTSSYVTIINPIDQELEKYGLKLNESHYIIEKQKSFPHYRKALKGVNIESNVENKTLLELGFNEEIVSNLCFYQIKTLKQLLCYSASEIKKLLNFNKEKHDKLNNRLELLGKKLMRNKKGGGIFHEKEIRSARKEKAEEKFKLRQQLMLQKQQEKEQRRIQKLNGNKAREYHLQEIKKQEPEKVRILGEMKLENFGFDETIVKNMNAKGIYTVMQLLEQKKSDINKMLHYNSAIRKRIYQVLENHKIETNFWDSIDISNLDLSEESCRQLIIKKGRKRIN